MDERSSIDSSSESIVIEDELTAPPKSKRVKVQPEDERRTVRFVLMTDVILKYTGPVTGIEYTFNRAGAIVAIDEADAYYILEKMEEHKSCCGGSNIPSKYLELVR